MPKKGTRRFSVRWGIVDGWHKLLGAKTVFARSAGDAVEPAKIPRGVEWVTIIATSRRGKK